MLAGMEEVGTGLLDRLDAMQRVAASAPGGPLLIVAGPGTGKTRTLDPPDRVPVRRAGRLPGASAWPSPSPGGPPRSCASAWPRCSDRWPRTSRCRRSTRSGCRSCGSTPTAVGLAPAFRIAEDDEVLAAACAEAGGPRRAGRAAATGGRLDVAKVLRAQDLVDLDELLSLPVALLPSRPALVDHYRGRWQWIFVDEYQDVDAGPVRAAAPALPAGRQPVRDRRPGPGDLLVPRRRRRVLPAVHPGLRTDAPASCG